MKLCRAILIIPTFVGLMPANTASTKEECGNTVCFSQNDCNKHYPYSYPLLGDDVKLCGGKCQGKTIPEMNALGWNVIQVITGLQSSFGVLLEKKCEKRGGFNY